MVARGEPAIGTRSEPRQARVRCAPGGHDRAWLVAIAVFRVVKASILIALAIGAFALVNQDLPALGERIVGWADLDREGEVVQAVLEKLPGVTPGMLRALGGGAIAYAALFLVEAYGLFRGRVWAEWLTIVATSSFVPLEVIEVIRRTNVFRVGALAVNVAIVGFLVLRRVRESSRIAEDC